MSGLTQDDIAAMSEAELAVFATSVKGFTAVLSADGRFFFAADWFIDQMSPSERAQLNIIGRIH